MGQVGLSLLVSAWPAANPIDTHMTHPSTAKPALSIEFFPPKTPQGVERLRAVRQELYTLNPEFCSVTFGAGGSTQEGTLRAVQDIINEGHVGVAHYSCVGATAATAREHLTRLAAMGVHRIVALRGDLPSGYGSSGEFTYAKDLVAFVVREFPGRFHVEVAAYPETHPQARSYPADLRAFVEKVKAGANSAITQYFFSAQAYFRFVEDVSAHSVHIPIVPGLMPITNSSQLLRFSDACGAEVPRWIRQRLESYGDDQVSIKAFGLEVMTRLCEELQRAGVPGIHFYSLNQSEAILGICDHLGWR
jgi:methylenetetrahydrofolate reductase (NADPH)